MDAPPEIPLGIEPEFTYMNHTPKTENVGRVILYTGGISELANGEGRRLATDGLARILETALRDCSDTARLLTELETRLSARTGATRCRTPTT